MDKSPAPSSLSVALQSVRSVQADICNRKTQRNRLRQAAQRYVRQERLIGPLSAEQLRRGARDVLQKEKLDPRFLRYAAVLLNNEVWRDRLAGIPFSRRLLLLPQCLRHPTLCRGRIDEYGLVCARCGNCLICDLQAEAESLGYVVMVAEGSPMVMALIESGQIEAVVGVSCLAVLEKVFPYMEAAAIPGIAIPLLRDGCRRTDVDQDWVWDAIHLSGSEGVANLDFRSLRRQIDGWFTLEALEAALGPVQNETERIGREWLARSGKRWRPFLTACVHQAMQPDPAEPLVEAIRPLLLAVECFHKASLIHDDIEDNDPVRYGQKTLHEEYGVPLALNVGDFLLGEGYRLIGEAPFDSERITEMLTIAARGHRTLCFGQGAELYWLRHREPLSADQVCEIFRQKTAPAFEVALCLGAAAAGADGPLQAVLSRYSEALGVAYQIRDDLQDAEGLDRSDQSADAGDPQGLRRILGPSLLASLAYELADEPDKLLLRRLWQDTEPAGSSAAAIRRLLHTYQVDELAAELLAGYQDQAIGTLSGLDNPVLKSMLRRVIGKIFQDVPVMGCCNDYQANDGPGDSGGRPVSAP
ncbi:MAG: polyprenyl synthetase family protein [Sedimentisphaerales bacterium]|nr:polyprenyl synthetase family protein [Sedimentisphaerales bacterium]